MTIPDGGPAFPRPIGNNGRPHFEDSEVSNEQEGMSLRDYFAAKAMQAYLAAPDDVGKQARLGNDAAAEWAYAQADAMLKAREAQRQAERTDGSER